jgi:acetyl-CoA C-acetyltransferase
MGEAFILDAVRTPRGRGKAGKGGLSNVHPQELVAATLRELARRSDLKTGDVDDVLLGVVSQVNEQGANIARNAVLAADWPQSVPALTLNRFCGSGLTSVDYAAMSVMSGAHDLVVAGGVESMSRVPMGSDGGGGDGNNQELRKKIFQVPQGISADLIATREGFSREDVDGWALKSQQRADAAIKGGYFKKSLVPVGGLDHDEHPRAGTTMEGLAKLEPSFVGLGQAVIDGRSLDDIARAGYPEVSKINHVHTAGNSSGIVDGAAAVLLASEAYVKKSGLKPRAKIRSLAFVGSEPVIMLTAPAPSSKKALSRAGMKASDIELWEINEAFAAVVLQTMRELGIDGDKVNVNGGAIALGHPLGATGAILLGTALDELERRNLSTALITLCIGGGQGVATIIERI